MSRGARIALTLLVLPVVLAGCGSKGKTISSSKLKRLVIERQDLPAGFSAFYFGKELSADVGPLRTDPARFDRLGGWTARYRRGGSAKTKGPLVVASRADLFKSEDGAKKDLALYQRGLAGLPSTTKFLPRVGQDALGIEQRQGSGPVSFVSYSIAWREANATSELDVNGFTGKLTLQDAVALARKQDARMRTFAR